MEQERGLGTNQDRRTNHPAAERLAAAGLLLALAALAVLAGWSLARTVDQSGEHADGAARVAGYDQVADALDEFDRLEDRYEEHQKPAVIQRRIGASNDFVAGIKSLRMANPGSRLAEWLEPRFRDFSDLLRVQFAAEEAGDQGRAARAEGPGGDLLERMKHRVDTVAQVQIAAATGLAEREREESVPLLWAGLGATALALIFAGLAVWFLRNRRRAADGAAGREVERARRDEQRVRESKARLLEAQRLAQIGNWELDPRTGAVQASEEALRLYGITPAEFGGSIEEILPLVHPDDRRMLAERLADPNRFDGAGQEAFETEYRVIAGDRTFRTLLVRGESVERADGSRVVAGTSQDITDRKEKDRALEEKRQAERAIRAKNEFLSRMSHELRTPLHSILGYGQLLEQSEAMSEEERADVRQILRAGDHLLSLIDEVLEMSRLDDERITAEIEPVNVWVIADETEAIIRPLAVEREIAIRIDAPEDGAEALADPRLLRQLLLNLLSNAVKYNRDGGEAVVHIQRCGERLETSVADSGIGIPPEMRKRLFVPFDRLGADNGAIPGIGLGLALSQRICKAMGTLLEFESQEGEGTRFWFALPVSDPSGNEARLKGRAPDSVEVGP